MKNPSDLKYNTEHEWVKPDQGGSATVGITHHAQDSMGEITYVELPEIGKEVEKGHHLFSISSAKAFMDLLSPISGDVIEVNEELETNPKAVNESPYRKGWIVKLRMSQPGELDTLMGNIAYEEFVIRETT